MTRKDLNNLLRRIMISGVVIVQMLFPAVSFAEEAITPTDPEATTSDTTTPPADPAPEATPTTSDPAPTTSTLSAPATGPTTPTGPQAPTGVQQPTGSSSSTYTFNEATGLWENDYYTWDPATGQTQPKTPQTYSYNPTTGMWDTTEWYYTPEAGIYVANVISTPVKPAGAANLAPAANSITNTGPNSNNSILLDGNTNGTFDLFFNSSISNKIGQMSRSGNALVQGNTWGGDAKSGDALALSNLLNMLQSSWGQLGSDDLSLFVANIDGTVTGDLYIDPNQLNSNSGNKNIDITVSDNAAIDNDIDIDVASGDAGVTNNTTGGNALTGDARAVVNLLNLINSAIKSNKSFIGVLNINGDLNGDILLPPDMLKAIIAATGPNSNNTITNNNNTDANITVADNKTINNNITTDAGSGNATVSDNTNGGNATTGNAEANVVLLNLTGKKVVAKDALLVFVNVMGSWVGLIFNAPSGTNAVAITGPGSTNDITSNNNTDLDVDVSKDSLINNDVNVAAHSGDATVSHNTNGGDATSGDASIGVNVLNMIDSEFDVSDWFGVLFINVFGNWVGSFGIDTAAGNTPVGANTSQNSVGVVPAATDNRPAGATFGFIPHNSLATASVSSTTSSGGQSGQTLGAQTAVPPSNQSKQAQPITSAPPHGNPLLWVSAVTFVTGILLLGGERFIVLLRGRQAF